MAGTDDVAREVADLLFDQTVKGAAAATDIVPRALRGIRSITSLTLGQVIDELRKNKELQKLMGMEGEISNAEMTELMHRFSQRSSSVMVGDMDVKDYDTLLKEQGVLYAKIDRQDDDCTMYVFLNKDLEKVENATRILQAQRGQVTELNAKLYFNSLSPDKVHVVDALDPVQTELFRHYARQQGLLYTVVPKKEGDMIVCNADDLQKARRALLYTGWALTGANGARVREQVERRLAGRSAINIAAEEGTRELYIVSRDNPGHYVHISATDYEVYKQSKQVSAVSRKDPDFYAKCMAASEGMSHPVVMTPEQFRSISSPEQMQNAATIDLFPDNHEDLEQIDKVNSFIRLVSQKMNLDNEHNATWGISDTSVSYSAFAAYEFFTDQEEAQAREREFEHFKKAAFYSEDNFEDYDVDMQEKSVDYIIAKAEEKRRQQVAEPDTRQPFWAKGNTQEEDKGQQEEPSR